MQLFDAVSSSISGLKSLQSLTLKQKLQLKKDEESLPALQASLDAARAELLRVQSSFSSSGLEQLKKHDTNGDGILDDAEAAALSVHERQMLEQMEAMMAEAAAAQARGGRRSSQELDEGRASVTSGQGSGSSGFSLGFASKILGGSSSVFSRNSPSASSPASAVPSPSATEPASPPPRTGTSVGSLFSGF